MVGLDSLTLRSLEAVDAAFSEDGSHACSPRLEHLAVKLLNKVGPCCMHACMGGAWGPRSHALAWVWGA